eukprot:IDg1401t1
MVFDTGVGPNCIARKALPPETEELIKPFPSIRVVRAGGKRLGIAGSIILKVRFGPYTVKTYFLLCESLQVDFLLGTEFIDRNVTNIHVQKKFIELLDGTEVPILRSIGKTRRSERRKP